MKKIIVTLCMGAVLMSCQDKNKKIIDPIIEDAQKKEVSEQSQPVEKTPSVDLTMFPQAEEGYQRVYIQLPQQENEHNYKVEVYVGKNVEVDTCNNHALMGEMSEKTLDGFGYTYYEVKSEGHITSTQMACPDDTKEIQWVNMEPYLTHYNSQLPIVIYVPNDFIVKYKIYTSGEFLDVESK